MEKNSVQLKIIWKNMILLLTIKRALCYSKKCAIVESYAMILHEKLSHKALFRRFCDNRAFCGPQKNKRRVKRQYGKEQNSSHEKRKKLTNELFQTKRSSSDAEPD